MKPALILLAILVVGGAIVWLIDRLFYHKQEAQNDAAPSDTSAHPTDSAPAQGCVDESCGIRSICPSEQILKGECKQEITYYEDEEEERWRDVLYTLQPADLLGWGQSIKHRGLVMPAAIRQEFMQLAAEHRGG